MARCPVRWRAAGFWKVALVLQDQSRMPAPKELSRRFDPITADWTYIRWLGDRKGIERITTTWDKTVIDRTRRNQVVGGCLLRDGAAGRQGLRVCQQSLWRARAQRRSGSFVNAFCGAGKGLPEIGMGSDPELGWIPEFFNRRDTEYPTDAF
jgi:hypothetical protein